MSKRGVILLAMCIAAAAAPVSAKTITVQMKNNGAGGAMVFEPAYIPAALGDTIHFVPTDPAHNAESIPTMLPAGATPFKGKINQPVDMKVDKPGVYGVKCLPHFSMGMVALVVVGKAPANLAAARAVKLPPFAAKRMTPLLAQVK